jgi:hypothetical protein
VKQLSRRYGSDSKPCRERYSLVIGIIAVAVSLAHGEQPLQGDRWAADSGNDRGSVSQVTKLSGVPDTMPSSLKQPERVPLAKVSAHDNSVERKQYRAYNRYANRVPGEALETGLREELLASGLSPEETTTDAVRDGAEEYVRRRVQELVRSRYELIESGRIKSGRALMAMLRPIDREIGQLRSFADEQNWSIGVETNDADTTEGAVALLNAPVPESTDKAETRLVKTLTAPRSRDLVRAQIRYVCIISERLVDGARDNARRARLWEILADTAAPKSMMREEFLSTVLESNGDANTSAIVGYLLSDGFDESPLSDAELRQLLGTVSRDVLARSFQGQRGRILLKRYPWLEKLSLPDGDPLRRAILSVQASWLVADPVEADILFGGYRNSKDDVRRLATLKAYGSGVPVPAGIDIGRWALDVQSPLDVRLAAIEVLSKNLEDSVNQRKTETRDLVRAAHLARQRLHELAVAQEDDTRIREAASKILTADRERCDRYRNLRRSELEGIVHERKDIPVSYIVRYLLEHLYALHMDYVSEQDNKLPQSLAAFGETWSSFPAVDRCPLGYIPTPPWTVESKAIILALTTEPYEGHQGADDESGPRVVALLLTDGRIREVDRETFGEVWRQDTERRATLGYAPVATSVLGAAREWLSDQ